MYRKGYRVISRSSGYRSAGLTLVEMMVTLAFLAIVIGLGVPSFSGLVNNNRTITQTNDFLSTLALARSEATKRRVPVAVCASDDESTCSGSTDWSTGWILFTDSSGDEGELDDTDELIQTTSSLTGGTSFTADASAVLYGRNGSLRTVTGSVFILEGADCSGKGRRIIAVMPAGYSNMQKTHCS